MIKFPDKKYNIIYADPPWKYKESWGNGSNEHTYPTMSNKDIKNMPVADITEDKAHLYLWVTNPFIKEGLHIIFGVKGKKLCNNKNTKNILIEKTGKHSQKPNVFRQTIISCSGDLPRIELFARETADGWDSWGNEITTNNREVEGS